MAEYEFITKTNELLKMALEGLVTGFESLGKAVEAIAEAVPTITGYFASFPYEIATAMIAIVSVVIALRVAGRA